MFFFKGAHLAEKLTKNNNKHEKQHKYDSTKNKHWINVDYGQCLLATKQIVV